jgi:hypothetical protein
MRAVPRRAATPEATGVTARVTWGTGLALHDEELQNLERDAAALRHYVQTLQAAEKRCSYSAARQFLSLALGMRRIRPGVLAKDRILEPVTAGMLLRNGSAKSSTPATERNDPPFHGSATRRGRNLRHDLAQRRHRRRRKHVNLRVRRPRHLEEGFVQDIAEPINNILTTALSAGTRSERSARGSRATGTSSAAQESHGRTC